MRTLWLLLTMLPWMDCQENQENLVTCYEGEVCMLPCPCEYESREYIFRVGTGTKSRAIYNTTIESLPNKMLKISKVDETYAGKYICQARVDRGRPDCMTTSKSYYEGHLLVISRGATLPVTTPTSTPSTTVAFTKSTDDPDRKEINIIIGLLILCIFILRVLGLFQKWLTKKMRPLYTRVQKVYVRDVENHHGEGGDVVTLS